MKNYKYKSYFILIASMICLVFLFNFKQLLAAPFINSTVGVISSGENLNISGGEFGFKNMPSPIKWDDFEVGTNGVSLRSVQPEWVRYDNDNEGSFYSDNDSHSQRLSVVNDFSALLQKGFATNYYQFSKADEVYVSYWWKVANIGVGDGAILKQTRINSSVSAGGGGVYHGQGSTSYGSQPPESYSLFTIYDNGATVTDENCCKIIFDNYNTWVRIDAYKKLSTPGMPDGIIQTNIIGVDEYFSDTEMTRAFGYSFQLDTVLLGLMDGGHLGSFEVYLDDIYIDNTRARVEIGDTAFWGNNTHREVQIPTTWSSDSITVTINQGSFNNGDTAYLFVVDENGEVNTNGYPITIGESESDTTPPQSPHGLAVY